MTDVKVTLTIKFSKEKDSITLTEEEARNLYNKLDGIFGTKWNYIPYYQPEPPAIPYSPSSGTGGKPWANFATITVDSPSNKNSGS